MEYKFNTRKIEKFKSRLIRNLPLALNISN